jgi:hypothetical protein
MSVNINADTTNGLVMTPDTSGEIKLQSAGADIATVDSSGITMAAGKTLPASALTGSLPALDGSSLTGIETGQVLEYITGVCDGTTVTTPRDTYTIDSCTTGGQNIGSSYVTVDGSTFTYTPPANTKKVIYRFTFAARWEAAHSIAHVKFFIDSSEVLHARTGAGGSYLEQLTNFEWVIDVGNSNNTNTGRLLSWTSDKTLKLTAREYGASNGIVLHQTRYWDGIDSQQTHRPTLTIIAVG